MVKLSDAMKTFLLLLCATVMSTVFYMMSQTIANITTLYIMFIVLIARYTEGYKYSIFASFTGVVFVNYFFTEPFMTLDFQKNSYPVTFVGMLAISLITGTTTTHLRTQQKMSAQREYMLDKLNMVNRELISSNSMEEIEKIRACYLQEFISSAPEFLNLFHTQVQMAIDRQKLVNEHENLVVEAEKENTRANLLRAISHDLRTPLTNIIGASQTCVENDIIKKDERKRLVKSIYDDAFWLLHMVENLLMVTRIDEKSARVSKTPEILEEVLSEAAGRFKMRYPNARLEVDIDEKLMMVPMDPMLIEQVILNLLENTVLHAQTSKEVLLKAVERDGNVVISVLDYGKGIDKRVIDNLFDGRANEKNNSGDASRGLGIGLSVCKTIVKAHGGEITAYNHEHGASFEFTIPMEDAGIYEQ